MRTYRWDQLSRAQQDCARRLSAKTVNISVSQCGTHLDAFAARDRGEIDDAELKKLTGWTVTWADGQEPPRPGIVATGPENNDGQPVARLFRDALIAVIGQDNFAAQCDTLDLPDPEAVEAVPSVGDMTGLTIDLLDGSQVTVTISTSGRQAMAGHADPRVRVPRSLLRAALADAIDWEESVLDSHNPQPPFVNSCCKPGARCDGYRQGAALLAKYKRTYARISRAAT